MLLYTCGATTIPWYSLCSCHAPVGDFGGFVLKVCDGPSVASSGIDATSNSLNTAVKHFSKYASDSDLNARLFSKHASDSEGAHTGTGSSEA